MKFQVQAIAGAFVFLSGLCVVQPAHANGADSYSSRCAMCHQPDGAGLPGQFPRLSGRAAKIASSPAGRALLAKILLFGMYGSIMVDGKAVNGLMPPMGSMTNQDLADVLNHVVALKKSGGRTAPFTAMEIAKLRANNMSGAAVNSERNNLAAKGMVP